MPASTLLLVFKFPFMQNKLYFLKLSQFAFQFPMNLLIQLTKTSHYSMKFQ